MYKISLLYFLYSLINMFNYVRILTINLKQILHLFSISLYSK